MAKLFANSGNPDQTPRSAASDLGLHCLPSTLLRVSRLQSVRINTAKIVCRYINFMGHNKRKEVHILCDGPQ